MLDEYRHSKALETKLHKDPCYAYWTIQNGLDRTRNGYFENFKTIHMMTRTSTPDDNVQHDLDPCHEWTSQNKLDWTTTDCTISTPTKK